MSLKLKYEKCRDITEIIYKRINITSEIKKLENEVPSEASELSENLDSDDVSIETDLFAYDKSDITSSTEQENSKIVAKNENLTGDKYININNNEERVKIIASANRPRKRYRKRIKKRVTQPKWSESDGSSDEAVPLSRIVEVDTQCKSEECSKSDSPDVVMGVPKIVIITKDLKPRIKQPDEFNEKIVTSIDSTRNDKVDVTSNERAADSETVNKTEVGSLTLAPGEGSEKNVVGLKSCDMCGLAFRGDRGLRRHVTMSHISVPEDVYKPISREKSNTKPG